MSLADDLLSQARRLAASEPTRPRQASLRRSVSSSYYALFHLLTEDAARRLVRSSDRGAHRELVRRAFSHGTMREACSRFSKGATPSGPAGAGVTVSQDVRDVASAFVSLQENRNLADYSVATTVTRVRAQDAVRLAGEAFAAWRRVRGGADADLLLLAMLLKQR